MRRPPLGPQTAINKSAVSIKMFIRAVACLQADSFLVHLLLTPHNFVIKDKNTSTTHIVKLNLPQRVPLLFLLLL